MKAEEARKITEQNQVKLHDVIAHIKDASGRGEDSLRIDNLGQEVMKELLKLGYNIGQSIDPHIGYTIHICKW